ncbi:uncharacterized protein PV09_04679 [Verruconis gallopava]|uniref:Uncharacterized protein n=1 Tax=Verruconis gallopava TaxID=253628 RepID=A0A0D1XPB0_9PEZI|nr:uncharacterized protein PV09_04679 [Verruconis gallopava]KIW04401.1 hypothetical protein PV09_04679 [Verruconis gallopava]
MAGTPPSGAETAVTKVAKDRNCPFCHQAFTSSSLGRHLDLYIKSKNPKPPDGIHDVEEIRKMRGNITRRQSRVASGVKRDTSSTPAESASARYSLYGVADDRATGGPAAPNALGKPRWMINKLSWEATGVINDLPPRIEPKPSADRRDSRREQLKAELDQRQKLTEELDTGKAAQLALKEILDTIRNAEASATGRHLFDDFDFFQQSFPSLCLRLLSPTPPLDSSLSISTSDSWSSSIPWDQQRDALSRIVEERGQILRRRSSLSSSASDEASQSNLNLDKLHRHINHEFQLWKSLPEHKRTEIWHREIIRSYVRIENDLKEARNTIKTLMREAEFLTKRLERAYMTGSSPYTPSFSDRQPSISVPPSPLSIPDDVLRDLCKQGINVREWDYERLLDRWKNVVRDERRASTGLSAQRNFSTSSQNPRIANTGANLSANGVDSTAASRSASITSAMSATGPTRTSSMDSTALDVDAEGEDEDMDDGIAPDAHPYTSKPPSLPPLPPQPTTQDLSSVPHKHNHHHHQHQHQYTQPNPPPPPPQHPHLHVVNDKRLPGIYPLTQTHMDQNYKWPHPSVSSAHQQPQPPMQLQPQPQTQSQSQQPQRPPQPQPQHTSEHAAGSVPPTNTTHTSSYSIPQLPDPETMRRIPPGPESWQAEFHHATTHSMEGLQGPATTGSAAAPPAPAAG